MRKTFNCHWDATDKLEVYSIGPSYHHFDVMSDGGSLQVVLTTDQLKELRDAINEELGPEVSEPVTKAKPVNKELSYAMLTPLAKKIYQHMKRAGSISAREAMADHGITSASLARRICDLEDAGIKVERDRRIHPLTRQSYTRYALAA